MIRRPTRSKRTDTLVPYPRSSDRAYHRLPDLSARAEKGEKAIDLDMPLESKFGARPKRASGQRPTAFLTVQEGCDKFCTYCVVPYTRGAEKTGRAHV